MEDAAQRTTILREPEVARITGLTRKARWAMAKRGEFPSPIWLTSKATGWLSDEIDAWIQERAQHRSVAQDKPWRPQAQGGTP